VAHSNNHSTRGFPASFRAQAVRFKVADFQAVFFECQTQAYSDEMLSRELGDRTNVKRYHDFSSLDSVTVIRTSIAIEPFLPGNKTSGLISISTISGMSSRAMCSRGSVDRDCRANEAVSRRRAPCGLCACLRQEQLRSRYLGCEVVQAPLFQALTEASSNNRNDRKQQIQI